MRHLRPLSTWILSVFLVVFCLNSVSSAQVRVRGYTRKDGTYVKPHYRSNPDGNFNNNWSTKGNRNPYTGKWGTRVTPPKGYGSVRRYGTPAYRSAPDIKFSPQPANSVSNKAFSKIRLFKHTASSVSNNGKITFSNRTGWRVAYYLRLLGGKWRKYIIEPNQTFQHLVPSTSTIEVAYDSSLRAGMQKKSSTLHLNTTPPKKPQVENLRDKLASRISSGNMAYEFKKISSQELELKSLRSIKQSDPPSLFLTLIRIGSASLFGLVWFL